MQLDSVMPPDNHMPPKYSATFDKYLLDHFLKLKYCYQIPSSGCLGIEVILLYSIG